LPIEEELPNVWVLKKTEAETMLAYIPLAKRIEFILDSVLESERKQGYQLDDFLIPLFTQLKNGLTPENREIMDVLRDRAYVKRTRWYPIRQAQPLFPLYPHDLAPPMQEDTLREHEQFIYQLARLGTSLEYEIWVGKNEQNKSDLLQRMSIRRLEIPGLSEKFITQNRVDQIDLLWLNADKGSYVAFEVENSTGIAPGILRMANLAEGMKHLNIPTYVVFPDKFRGKAQRIFDSPGGHKLGSKNRRFIVYSKLLHHIDLLNKGVIEPAGLLEAVSESA
jgi:hypothetical protein